jgi:hypothetical protein
MIQVFIQEMSGSNLGQDNSFPREIFLWFSSVSLDKWHG